MESPERSSGRQAGGAFPVIESPIPGATMLAIKSTQGFFLRKTNKSMVKEMDGIEIKLDKDRNSCFQ